MIAVAVLTLFAGACVTAGALHLSSRTIDSKDTRIKAAISSDAEDHGTPLADPGSSHAIETTPPTVPTDQSTLLPKSSSHATMPSAPTSSLHQTSPPATTLHLAYNERNHIALAKSLGPNLFGAAGTPTHPEWALTELGRLPAGAKALIWTGSLGVAASANTCAQPSYSFAQFIAQDDILAKDARVLGYFLADEPNLRACPGIVEEIRARADYIRSHAPQQKSFIVVLDGTNRCNGVMGCEYAAFRPSRSHVDLVGVDPYPCFYARPGVPAPLETKNIRLFMQSALDSGIAASQIVPIYQTFGDEGRTDGATVFFRIPTALELQSMFDTWESLVPNPVFDAVYTLGAQCTASSCPSAQALISHPELQTVARAHNK